MTKTPAFIREILTQQESAAPDRARFMADSAAYLFLEDQHPGAEARIQHGLASARACCCELREQIRAALTSPVGTAG